MGEAEVFTREKIPSFTRNSECVAMLEAIAKGKPVDMHSFVGQQS